MRLRDSDSPHPQHVEHDEQESGNERPGKQIADGHGIRRKDAHVELRLLVGARQNIAEQYQGDRGRNDLAERAGGGDGARCQARVIAMAEHGGQRHQAHGHNRGADDAGARRHEHAHEGYGQSKAPWQASENKRKRVEQTLRNLRFLEDHTHQHEQRNSDQRLVGDRSEDASGQESDVAGVEYAGSNAAAGKEQGHAAEGECDRITCKQEREDCAEHQQGQELEHQATARSSSSIAGALPSSLSAIRATSAMPWRTRRPPSTGMSVLSRNTASMPPTSADPSRIDQARPV